MKNVLKSKRNGWTALEYIVGAVVIASMVALILGKFQDKLVDYVINNVKF